MFWSRGLYELQNQQGGNISPSWQGIVTLLFQMKKLMLCLHLGMYRGNHLLTKPWYICTVFTLAQITEVNLSSITITIKSKWRQILKLMHEMPAFIREAVALVVLAFYFLVLELQTQVSRCQRLLLLQHLKKSRRKRFINFASNCS